MSYPTGTQFMTSESDRRGFTPAEFVYQIGAMMANEEDPVVLTNCVGLLYGNSLTIDDFSQEVCREIANSRTILNKIFEILQNQDYNQRTETTTLVHCAAGNLSNISILEEGRAALLGLINNDSSSLELSALPSNISTGVETLIKCLTSNDINVAIFAITTLHNLLVDSNNSETAKRQIKYGIPHIVELLNNHTLQNYEFTKFVLTTLDCLSILSCGKAQDDNKQRINDCNGPCYILNTIREYMDKPHETDELIKTALEVLKSLSCCRNNKRSIILNNGIDTLYQLLRFKNNIDIIKSSLCTIRHLSDLLSSLTIERINCIQKLTYELIQIVNSFSDEPQIITYTLGILENVTCNNEPIKEFVINQTKVIDPLIKTADYYNRNQMDTDTFTSAVKVLCHITNISNPVLAERAKTSILSSAQFDVFKVLYDHLNNTANYHTSPYKDLCEKLNNLFRNLNIVMMPL